MKDGRRCERREKTNGPVQPAWKSGQHRGKAASAVEERPFRAASAIATVVTPNEVRDPHFTRNPANFFCARLNGITFPHSSGGIHFLAFLLKLSGMKNSMIFAINHPTSKNKIEMKKFLL